MKLSNITLKILQYFSRLSEFIYFNVENKGFISLMNQTKDLYCYYVLNDKEKEINEFVLYHYNEILEMMKSLNDEEIEFQFNENEVVISDNKTTFSYKHANKELINMNKRLLSIPSFKIEHDIEFFIKGKELYSINKILKAMKMEEYCMSFDDEKVFVRSINQTKIKDFRKELGVNKLSIRNKEKFEVKLFISSLRDLCFSFDYNVKIFKKLNLVVLNAIINVKREGKIVSREIPFFCLLLGKKV